MTFEDPQRTRFFFSLMTSFNDMEASTASQALDGFEAIEFSAHKGRSCASNFSLITLQPGPPFDQHKLPHKLEDWNMQTLAMGYIHAASINK